MLSVTGETGQPVRVSAPMSVLERLQRPSAFAWAFRLVWASLPLLAGSTASAPFGHTSGPVGTVGIVGLWCGWFVVLTASLVPTTVSLTAVRLLAPIALVAEGIGLARHATVASAVVALSITVAAVVLAFTGEFALVFVQGSAYGDETRFPLRPPGPLLLGPLPIGWAVVFALAIGGPLLLAAGVWVLGGLATAVGVVVTVVFARRCHRLARRYLVLVPAGVVLHDHLVMADTIMLRKPAIASVRLAEIGTEAADLTGKALGNAIEIQLHDFETVVLAGTLSKPGGTAIHARGLLVSPSRPGYVLDEARRRGLRVR